MFSNYLFFTKACEAGDAKKVIELLGKEKGEAYALVNDPDPDSRATALHLASAGGHMDCVTLIRGAGAALEVLARFEISFSLFSVC